MVRPFFVAYHASAQYCTGNTFLPNTPYVFTLRPDSSDIP